MRRGIVKTWMAKDIESAIASALRAETCPRCPSLLDATLDRAPSVIEAYGPWTLSVGPSDVLVTVPAICHIHCHQFVLRVDLWRRAKTPDSLLKIKGRIKMTPPSRPRPLAGI